MEELVRIHSAPTPRTLSEEYSWTRTAREYVQLLVDKMIEGRDASLEVLRNDFLGNVGEPIGELREIWHQKVGIQVLTSQLGLTKNVESSLNPPSGNTYTDTHLAFARDI